MALAKNGFEQIYVECELYPTFIQVIFIRAYTHTRTLEHSLTRSLTYAQFMVHDLWEFKLYNYYYELDQKTLLGCVSYVNVNVTSMIPKKMSLFRIYANELIQNSEFSEQFHSNHITNMKYDSLCIELTVDGTGTHAFFTASKVNLSSLIRAICFAFNRIIPPSTNQTQEENCFHQYSAAVII